MKSTTRPVALWRMLNGSLWFLPSVLTFAAGCLAVLTLWLDHRISSKALSSVPFLFSGWSDGARAVLATIAGSIITVTGVVFSITIVALQLASTQFTPRVLRSFTEDRANQIVLGVFIGTFTYALLILRSVRSVGDNDTRFIPTISVTCAIGLCLVSIGFLIFFINHIATSIRAEMILSRVTDDALKVAERLYPEERGAQSNTVASYVARNTPSADTARLVATSTGYLQVIDVPALVRAAQDNNLLIVMKVRVGDFVIAGDAIAEVEGADSVDRCVMDDMLEGIQLGTERTNQQDISRGLIELVDIGVRALSPGTNDPTTALVAVDRVTEVLAYLASRHVPDPLAYDDAGTLRFTGKGITFDSVAVPPYATLRYYGAGHPEVAIRIIESLGRLANRLPDDERMEIVAEIRETTAAAERTITSERDLHRIRDAARRALTFG